MVVVVVAAAVVVVAAAAVLLVLFSILWRDTYRHRVTSVWWVWRQLHRDGLICRISFIEQGTFL